MLFRFSILLICHLRFCIGEMWLLSHKQFFILFFFTLSTTLPSSSVHVKKMIILLHFVTDWFVNHGRYCWYLFDLWVCLLNYIFCAMFVCRDLQSYLSHLSLFLAPESNKFYVLVDNQPWLREIVSRPAHIWQLMVTKVTKALLFTFFFLLKW